MGGGPRAAHASDSTSQLAYGVHISLAPTWFDPAETPSLITPYLIYYALHDALLKPMPGEPMANSLAESWSANEDGLSYTFVLRDGVTFHNGDKLTADDVRFSFERYRGAAKGPLHDRVSSVETPDARHITFRLKNITQGGSGSFGNAATRFETFVVKGRAYAYTAPYEDLVLKTA
jgi:peptide/nickel transport system substrate-binding protein